MQSHLKSILSTIHYTVYVGKFAGHTCATKGVMMAPILDEPEKYPIAVLLILVGYTSGVYTNRTWNAPVAKARMKNRNEVMTSL